MSEKNYKPNNAKAEIKAEVEKKPESPKAKVLDYNKDKGVIVYEFKGAIYQSNSIKYDGVSEYINL